MIGQHASRSIGSFAPRFAPFQNQHFHSPFSQGNRQRKANNPATDDDDVPSLHEIIINRAELYSHFDNFGDRCGAYPASLNSSALCNTP